MKRPASRRHGPGPSVVAVTRPRRFLICLAVLAASTSFAPAATWVRVGPEGADVHALVFDPADCSVVYAGTGAGLYRSADHGETWSLWSLRDTYVRAVGVHPARPQQIWVLAEPNPFPNPYSDPRPVLRSFDGGRTFSATSRPDETTYIGADSIALDPDDPETAYIADPQRYRVLATHDGGASWSTVPLKAALWLDVVAARGNVWAMSTDEVVRSTDRGITWQPCAVGLASEAFLWKLTRDAPYGRLWLITDRGLYVSDDGAERWFRADSNLPPSRDGELWIHHVAVAPSAPDTILVATHHGLFKTTDAVNHWVNVGAGPAKQSDLVVPVFDPCDPDRILWAGRTGPFLSRDGGVSWATPARGMVNTTINALYAAPGGMLWTSALMQGIFKSADGGRTWAYAGGDLPYWEIREERPSFVVVAFATTSGGLFACTTWGLYVTRDAGTTWNPVPGTERCVVRALLEDPARPGTLVAAAEHVGTYDSGDLLSSNDGGRTWRVVLDPWPGARVDATAVVADPRDGALLAAVRETDDGTKTSWSGVVRSTDHGATWSRIGELPGAPGALIADPIVFGRFHATSAGRIYRSEDGGASWHPALDPSDRCPGSYFWSPESLVADATGATLLAGVRCDVFTSRDHGLTWQLVGPGLPWPAMHALASNAGGELIVGTDGWGAALLELVPGSVRRHLPRAAPPGDALRVPSQPL